MIRISYQLIAEERLILSRTSASAGLHECLDFIPGSTLLGAAAAKFYPAWKKSAPDKVFAMFHSGAVSFGDAHPHDATGRPTLPVPLSLHHAKPKAGDQSGAIVDCGKLGKRLHPDLVLNLAASDHPQNEQWQQLRAGWVGPDGLLHQVTGGHVMKTARDSDRLGAPDDGKLFGFSYMEAGQIFSGCILVDESQKALAEELQSWIGSGLEIQVGRSHRAEFGRCSLKFSQDDYDPLDEASQDHAALPESLVLLAHSDWWLPGGLPREGADLHPQLSGYALVPSRTFARFRRYAPWNGFRGYPDPERQVIAKGSVITLQAKAAPPAITFGNLRESLLCDGIGAGQIEGLGRVLIHPSLVAGERPAFLPPLESANAKSVKVKAPENDYLPGIEARWVRGWIQVAADNLANELVQQWGAFRPRPRKSQWATLRTMAANAKDVEEFKTKFNTYAATGAAKWKWSGTSGGTGDRTLAMAISETSDRFRTMAGNNDPRANADETKNRVFLAAVTEAARRLRDH